MNAKCPDMMVDEYLQRKMVNEALRMAKKYVPSRVTEINSRVGKGGGGGTVGGTSGGGRSGAEKLKTAKIWEEQREWRKAIQAYLDLDEGDCDDHDTLEECWNTAVHLVMTHEKDKLPDVVNEVGKRLVRIKRLESAADL